MNDVALRANDVLRNEVMLRINDVALRANGELCALRFMAQRAASHERSEGAADALLKRRVKCARGVMGRTT